MHVHGALNFTACVLELAETPAYVPRLLHSQLHRGHHFRPNTWPDRGVLGAKAQFYPATSPGAGKPPELARELN